MIGSPALLVLWGFAEALWWPLIPDAGLALASLAAPRRGPRLALAAVCGSVAGGAVGYLLHTGGMAPPMPLTTAAMGDSAAAWLDLLGPSGMIAQPLSGIPYKVFVAEAAATGVSLPGFLVATAVTRGARMLAAALLFAGIGLAVDRWVPERQRGWVRVLLSVLTSVVFLAGLWALVRSWS